jgi:hypothetical protein
VVSVRRPIYLDEGKQWLVRELPTNRRRTEVSGPSIWQRSAVGRQDNNRNEVPRGPARPGNGWPRKLLATTIKSRASGAQSHHVRHMGKPIRPSRYAFGGSDRSWQNTAIRLSDDAAHRSCNEHSALHKRRQIPHARHQARLVSMEDDGKLSSGPFSSRHECLSRDTQAMNGSNVHQRPN